MNLDPAQLAALSAVLSLGSFDAAAARLGVTPSAISQRIRALEERVGTALVIRATPCRATPQGARLARHADDVALLERDLAAELGQAQTPARLRLAINADSLATWVLPALAGLDHLYDIVIDDQAHSADWLRRGEVAAAITDHAATVQGCTAHALGALAYVATCSPEFHRRWFGAGVTADALANAPMLQFNEKDALQHAWLERVTGARLMPPSLRLPSSHGFLEAARLGFGWGLNPASMARPLIEAGALVALRRNLRFDVPLVWQVRRLTEPALAPLTAAIRRHGRAALVQGG